MGLLWGFCLSSTSFSSKKNVFDVVIGFSTLGRMVSYSGFAVPRAKRIIFLSTFSTCMACFHSSSYTGHPNYCYLVIDKQRLR